MVARATSKGKSWAASRRTPTPPRRPRGARPRRRPREAHRVAVRGRSAPDHARAVRLRPGGERLGRALGAQHARLGLVEQELEILAAEAREQSRALLDAESLDRDALGAQRLLRRRLPAVAAAGEPHEPALDQQVGPRLGLELAPQRARAAGGRGVAGVGAVAAADQARLAAPRWRGGRPARTGRRGSRARPRVRATMPARRRRSPRRRSPRSPCGGGRYRAAGARPARRRRVAPVRPLRGGPAAARDAGRRGPGQGARRRVDPRQRDGGRAVVARLRRRGHRPGWSCGWWTPSTRTGCGGHAPQRARGRSQPQLRAPLARGGRPVRHVLPGAAGVLRAGVAGGACGSCGGSTRTSASGPTSTCASSTSPAEPIRASCARYARRVGLPARTLPNNRGTATSWQNARLRGRARRRRAARRAAARTASARRHAEAVLAAGRATARAGGRSATAHRLAGGPVRRRPPRPDARLRAAPATTASAPSRCATRR